MLVCEDGHIFIDNNYNLYMFPIVINHKKHTNVFNTQYATALQTISDIKSMFGLKVSKLSYIKDNLINSAKTEEEFNKIEEIQKELERLENLFLQV